MAEALWAEELSKAGNREGLADRLEFHGTLFLRYTVKCSGLSPQTVRKHFDALVAEGRALKSTRYEDAWHYVPENS